MDGRTNSTHKLLRENATSADHGAEVTKESAIEAQDESNGAIATVRSKPRELHGRREPFS